MVIIIISSKDEVFPHAVGPFVDHDAAVAYLEAEMEQVSGQGFRVADDIHWQVWVENQLVFTVCEADSPRPGGLVKVVSNQRFAKSRKG
jgi:hypothetical protein